MSRLFQSAFSLHRCLLLLILVVAGIGSAVADVPSIRAALKRNIHDTTRIRLLNDLGGLLIDQGSYDEAGTSLTEALNRSRKIRNEVLEGIALRRLGVLHFYQGNNQDAMKHWKPAMAIAERRGDKGEYYSLRMNVANVELAMGDILSAQQGYYEALHWAESNNKPQEVVKCLINISVLYGNQERHDSSRHYLERAWRDYSHVMDPFLKANVLNNLSSLETRKLGKMNVDDMEKWARALLELSIREGLKRFEGCAYETLGIVGMQRGRRIEARDYFNKGLKLQVTNNDDRQGTSTKQRMAELNLNAVENGDVAYLARFYGGSKAAALAEAHSLLDTVIVFFREQEEADQLCNAYESLSGVARAQGNPAAALEYYMYFKKLSDSLFNAERDRRMTEKSMTYAFEKKEAATRAEQEKKDQRQRFIRNGIAGVLIIVLLFLGVVWRQRNRINKERERSEELLLNILPEEVAGELKEKGSAEARYFDHATVLFTDFKGFTQLSEQVTPAELVEELNSCFKAFDVILDKYGVEKIKTIGDAYMAVGGLPDPQQGSPADVVMAALEMQAFMRQYRQEREGAGKLFFEMRLGIHTGPVVAGIVGLKKFQYDIWGDTVNTASRMESSGEAGKVNISGSTWALVRDHFRCTYRGKVQAKGKGDMDMYFVYGVV